VTAVGDGPDTIRTEGVMKYEIVGWIALVSVTIWAAPYVVAFCDLIQ
jgi:hypothetical protein